MCDHHATVPLTTPRRSDQQPRCRQPQPAALAAALAAASPLALETALPEDRGTTLASATRPWTSSGRRRLWELPHKYHCPIIGTCLHVDELRTLARKAGTPARTRLSDYEIHVSFVAAATDRNPLAVAAQKALERKYASTIKRLARIQTTAELAEHWQTAGAEGQVPATLWAIMTHARADDALRVRLYEDVHMLSHQIGAGLSADMRVLTETRAALAAARQAAAAEAERHARRLAARDARIAHLEAEISARQDAARALSTAQTRIAELEQGAELAALRARVAELSDLLADCTRQGALARQRAAALAARLEAATAASSGGPVARSLAGSAPGATACSGDCADCNEADPTPIDLGGRRILCVGGRGSLTTRYRDLVRRCKGELLRHDGGLEDSRQRLETLLATADAVLCPADNCSHDAYQRAKRFCKRTNKPCLLLERSGISAFTHALATLATAASAPAPGHGAVRGLPAHRPLDLDQAVAAMA